MTDQNIENIAYSTDASGIEGNAEGVFFPKTSEEVAKIIRENSRVVVRGGGSGLAGGAVPLDSRVIDLSKMNSISAPEQSKASVWVEAGVILDELNSFFDSYGLEFPVQPSSHSICTIGGMIATNAVGNRAIKYGKTSNWIEELEVVNGKGEIVKVGKNDIQDFAGMEGITGVITRAKLKLVEKRERTASLFKLNSIPEIVEQSAKLKLDKEVSEIEFLDKLTSSFLGLGESYYLIAEYESENGKMMGEDYDKLMELRDRAYPVLANQGYTSIEDPKILGQKFVDLALYLEKEKIPFFGHLGVGIIHPVFKAGQEKKIKDMLFFVRKLHGSVSGEHGIGLKKKEFLDTTEKKIIQKIKERHDPDYKINFGKVIDKENG